KHEADWLGPLASFVSRPAVDLGWFRGWVDNVSIRHWTEQVRDALIGCPACRLMRVITIRASEQYESIDLSSLFRSANLASLEHLTINYPGFADAEVEDLVSAGLIERLRTLDLSHCSVTDEGAVMLARCPDVPRLAALDLAGNFITAYGIDALAQVGVRVSSSQRFNPAVWDTNRA